MRRVLWLVIWAGSRGLPASRRPVSKVLGRRDAVKNVVDHDLSLVNKGNLWLNLVRAYGRPRAATLMPETYVLRAEEDVALLRAAHVAGKRYVVKNVSETRRRGIVVTRNLTFVLGAASRGYHIAQAYAADVFAVEGRKVNARAWLMVSCDARGRKKRFFLYREAKCVYAARASEGSDSDDDAAAAITSPRAGARADLPLTFHDLGTALSERNASVRGVWASMAATIGDVAAAVAPRLCRVRRTGEAARSELFGVDVLFSGRDLSPLVVEVQHRAGKG